MWAASRGDTNEPHVCVCEKKMNYVSLPGLLARSSIKNKLCVPDMGFDFTTENISLEVNYNNMPANLDLSHRRNRQYIVFMTAVDCLIYEWFTAEYMK